MAVGSRNYLAGVDLFSKGDEIGGAARRSPSLEGGAVAVEKLAGDSIDEELAGLAAVVRGGAGQLQEPEQGDEDQHGGEPLRQSGDGALR